ncbi:MAG: hypothetical protein HYU73_14765 [Betaproteobacteria bacterium]|nr:hypothetical protein [Betaproteobacteria bacterium]MBI3053428.1 hypothetical protein [Betaproteobacteria bacterium]
MKRRQNILLLAALMAFTQFACADVYLDATAGRGQEITPAYFGVHFHRLVLRPQEKAVRTQWPPLTFGTVRLWDSVTRWADIAPRAGVWEFERLDYYVHEAAAHRATVLYTLGSTPRWASARPDEPCGYGPGCGAEPVRMGHWEEYVRRVAQRYGSRIAAYELWNEPYFSDIAGDRGRPGFYTGSIFNMVEMARVARKVLDDVSAAAMLCTPGFVGGANRLEMFLAAGGKKYVQAICYHFYSENSSHLARQILEIRSVMKRQGLENLPLWNTETGLEVYGPGESLPAGAGAGATRSLTESAAKMTQQLILGAAAGLGRYYYYSWDSERSGMVTTSGEHLPAYAAMAQVQKWLIGATLAGCESFKGAGVMCGGNKGSRHFKILWAEVPATQAVTVPRGFRFAGQEMLWRSAQESRLRVADGKVLVPVGQPPVLLWFDATETK